MIYGSAFIYDANRLCFSSYILHYTPLLA